MKLSHISDPHLGFRRHDRMTKAGTNVRENDVSLAFRAAIDGVIAARPGLVVLSGDIFHRVSPGNIAIVFAHEQLSRLRQALPDSPVVMIAGDHDSPRRSDSGCILPLFRDLGVDVATREVQSFVYPTLDLRVVAVPDAAVKCGDEWGPGPERYQVLAIHGETDGVIPGTRETPRISAGQLEGWSYVALGHYHTTAQVGARAWYAGATDYTTTDVWGELKDEARHGVSGKGWLLADLVSGDVQRQAIPSARAVLDLEPIDATGLTSEQVDATIAACLEAQDINGAIVRLIITDIPVAVSRQLAAGRIRQWKAQALHLSLDLRRPEIVHSAAAAEFLAMRRQPFGEMYTDYMARRVLTPGLDRATFLALAQTTLDETEREYAEPKEKRGAA